MLFEKDIAKLRKYSREHCDLILCINEMTDNEFCIRPVRWSGHFSKGKLVLGKYLAKFKSKEEAIVAMVTYCGYSREFAESMAY